MKLKDEGIHFTFLCVAGFVAGFYGVKSEILWVIFVHKIFMKVFNLLNEKQVHIPIIGYQLTFIFIKRRLKKELSI
jgi:hypothetical protein